MCGRYDNLIARDAYRGLFKAGRVPNSNFPPRYNVAPTDQIPIVRIDPRDGEREVVMARWGLASRQLLGSTHSGFVGARQLAKRLDVDEQSVRISRVRKTLEQQF